MKRIRNAIGGRGSAFVGEGNEDTEEVSNRADSGGADEGSSSKNPCYKQGLVQRQSTAKLLSYFFPGRASKSLLWRVFIALVALAVSVGVIAHLVSYDVSVAIASMVRSPNCNKEPSGWTPPVEYKVMPHPSEARYDNSRGSPRLRGETVENELPIGMSIEGVPNAFHADSMEVDQVASEEIGIYRVYSRNEIYSPTLGQRNLECYADTHGYTLADGNQFIDATKPLAWTKIIAAQHLLPQFKWIFYIDADALIVEPSRKLERLLDKRYDLIITADQEGVNSGAFFLQNTAWSREFLQRLMKQDHLISAVSAPFLYEQRAFHYLLQVDRSVRQHMKILPSCFFNSRLEVPFWHPDLYIPGHFVIHMAGKHKREKAALMLPFREKALQLCPYKHY
eukprot:gb/GECG01007057.1/.p1 GENE.gb/GECG01007057.1/~~gb/GECG01007057.1/.p1  ORF type:complete len:394 (+),score=37.37 gb/GECG01007057.1/:1-1182(+)